MRQVVAAGMGVGWIPRRLWGSDNGAGTFGALLGGVIGLALWPAPWWIDLAVAAAVVGASMWAAAPEARHGADPGWVVIDEVAGALVAVVGLTGFPWVAAWAVARLADIFKVLPGTAHAEALPGAAGVTFDDVVAGLYGLTVGWILTAL